MRNRWRSVAFGVQGANGRRSTPGAIALTNALLRSAYEEALVTGVSYPGVEAIRVRTSDGEGAIVDLFEQVTGQIWNGFRNVLDKGLRIRLAKYVWQQMSAIDSN